MRIYKFVEVGNTFIRAETGERKATCAMCSHMIPGGHMRIRFSAQCYPQEQPNGGTITRNIKLYHIECFWNALDIEKPYSPQKVSKCWDCAVSLDKPINWGWVRHGNTSWSTTVCTDCVKSGRWRFCTRCGQYAQRFSTSPIIDEGVVLDRYLCDGCQDESGVLTVKVQKRLNRRDR